LVGQVVLEECLMPILPPICPKLETLAGVHAKPTT